jgi:hypothetical protein
MSDFILLMRAGPHAARDRDWHAYLDRLRGTGRFSGGSAIGAGLCVCKSGPVPDIVADLVGYLRVTAQSIEDVRILLDGNPVFEAGGVIEIRELPSSDG